MLGADLPGEEDELLGAHALGVHVDHELQADLLETAETEVGHLDAGAFGRRQDDAGTRQERRGSLAGLGVGHSVTGVPLVADSCSASSVRACPSASSRPSRSCASPRIASLRFSSSSR